MTPDPRVGIVQAMGPNRYDLIVADPPWNYSDTLRQSKTKRGARDVYTAALKDREFFELPVSQLAADRAVCVMWVTSSHLEVGLRLLRVWGFRYTQMGAWGKVQKGDLTKPKIGMGRLFRQSVEPYIVGVRGGAHQALELMNQSNLILQPAGEHSAKPEELQDRLEQMFPSMKRRLELFARRPRRRWTCVGNEIDGQDIRDALQKLLFKRVERRRSRKPLTEQQLAAMGYLD